jgi:pyrroline-5-carboxylate reductase
MNLNDQKICFIGAGNMANAIVGGLVKNGFPANQITASAPSEDNLKQIKSAWGVEVSQDNQGSAAKADIIILSVKPQVLKVVCEGLSAHLSHQPLVISIAAGIGLTSLSSWLGDDLPIIRCMPNTPSQVLQGASGLIGNSQVNDAHKLASTDLFSAIGIVEWLDEEQKMHAVTALSGSGPAYIFLVIEAMEAAAVKQGIAPATARRLAAQTVAGAAEMVLSSDIAPSQLKRNVMSPGGTTERAIQTFEACQLTAIFEKAMTAAANRSVTLSEELSA